MCVWGGVNGNISSSKIGYAWIVVQYLWDLWYGQDLLFTTQHTLMIVDLGWKPPE